MKLSTAARYALRLLVEIARQGAQGQAVSLGKVARKTLISRRYLDQLATGLKKAELIEGVSGRSGGYRLSKPSEEIRIGQIFEAVIGPINIVDCVRNPQNCLASDNCECRWLYLLINKRICDVLYDLSLDDLATAGPKNICQDIESPSECPMR